MIRLFRYLHELADWPHVTWGGEVATPLAQVAHRQGVLTEMVRTLGFTENTVPVDAVNLAVITTDVVTTSAIEGETLSREQVRSSVARHLGIDTGLPVPVKRDVEGIVDVLIDATQNSRQPLTAARLKAWHHALFPTGWSGMKKITVGDWRSGEMEVVSGPISRERVHFEAPGPQRLAEEMRQFLAWFNGPDDPNVYPLLKSAIAHLWFVTIHPFDDGNGRIARAITDLQLARSDNLPGRFYSLSSQMLKEQKEYYDALERAQKGTLDITSWLVWYLGCLDRAMQNTDRTLETVRHKSVLWRRLATVSVNARQREMLEALFGPFEGKLTAAKWAKMTKTSKATAVRDINVLLEHDVLVEDPAGRSTSYRLAEP